MTNLRKPGKVIPGVAAVLLLTALTAGVYRKAGDLAFVNCDDPLYVAANPEVRRGLTAGSLAWSLGFHAGNWHPLTWLSHMLDVQLFGLAAGRHHQVNVLLHLAGTLVLFALLRGMTGALWRSFLAAALFAVHPLHVESVAWIAERKDVLSTFLWLSSMAAWLSYARRPGVRRYAAAFLLWAFSLTAKAMPVTMPLMLLVLDWWPLGRWAPGTGPVGRSGTVPVPFSRPLIEKIPFLSLSAAAGLLTIAAQRSGRSLRTLAEIPFGARLANALWAYLLYAIKTVWPSGLSIFYAHPVGVASYGSAAAGLAFMLLASWATFRLARRHPFLAAGWIWYVVTLLPVIGLVQVGDQAAADRYTYVPSVGLFLAVSWGLARLARGRAVVLATAAAASVAVLAVLAAARVGDWRDSLTLFERAVAVAPDDWLSLNNLGAAYDDRGELAKASACYLRSLDARPGFFEPLNNLGVVRMKQGRLDEALFYFQAAARADAGRGEPLGNIGLVLQKKGLPLDALPYYRRAVSFDPGSPMAWRNLGGCQAILRSYRDAAVSYRRAVDLAPDEPQMRVELALVYLSLGDRASAETEYGVLKALDPSKAAWLAKGLGRYDDRPGRRGGLESRPGKN